MCVLNASLIKIILIILNNVDSIIKHIGLYLKKYEIFYFYLYIIYNYDKYADIENVNTNK